MKYTKTDGSQIEGDPGELVDFFGKIGTPDEERSLNKSIKGWVVIACGIAAAIMMIACALMDRTSVYHIIWPITIVVMCAFCILLHCKYGKTAITVVVTGLIFVTFALILGITTLEQISNKAVDSAVKVAKSE